MSETTVGLPQPTAFEALDFCKQVEALPALLVTDPSTAYTISIDLRACQEKFAIALQDDETAAPLVSYLSTALQSAHNIVDKQDRFVHSADPGRRAYHNLANLITEDIADELMDRAETSQDPSLELEIAVTLFEGHSLHAGSMMDGRKRDFLAVRLPDIARSMSNRMAILHGSERSWPSTTAELYGQESAAMDRFSDTLRHLFMSTTGPHAVLIQNFSQLFDLSDTDPIIRLALHDCLLWSGIKYVSRLAGIPSSLAYGVENGFGESDKCSLTSTDYYLLTIRRMLSLERQCPGICRTLYRENGFRNFGRHSEEFFLDIYNRRGELTQYDELVYIAFNTYDSNGSVLRNSGPKLEALRKKLLAHSIGVVVAEFMEEYDLKILMRRARMAKLAKACIVIADSHGGENALGNGITKEMLRDWLGDAVAEITTEDVQLFLTACSVAKYRDGFASTLHQTSGKRTVLGARGGAYIRRINFWLDKKGRPRLQINSGRKGDTRGRQPLRTFRKGLSSAAPNTLVVSGETGAG